MDINNNNDLMFHIALNEKMIESAKKAILPGDPGRCESIAKLLDNSKFIAKNREYASYIGYISGEPVLVMSTGMGGPSAAIAIEELYRIGVRYVIRVGTCGGMQKNVEAGDLIIANAAVRHEGTSREYMPIEFPATADFGLTSRLVKACEALNFNYHVGTVHSKDSFYGQHSPELMPVGDMLKYKWEAFKKGGVLASEMEAAAIFTVSSVLGMKAGAVLLCIWNQELGYNKKDFDTDKAIKVAIKALNHKI